MPRSSGTRLGPYEIVAPLGAGGMGEVYRARDLRLGREVAIKILPAEFARDPERLRRFEQEARIVAALDHPNILAIHDIGTQDSSPFLVSELLEGQSLRERLRDGPLATRKGIEYALQIVQGLSAAHDKGISHRDLKPDNIFLTADGRLKILDFGLARAMAPARADLAGGENETLASVHTTPGMVMGTVGYMSPEQVAGRSVDHRSDIFSFGAVLYEMLLGQRAFQGNSSVEIMNAILKEDPSAAIDPRRVSPALENIVRRCLEKSPEERFQSAKDLGFALANAEAFSSAALDVRAAPLRRLTWARLAAFLGVVAIGVLVALAVLTLWEPPVAPSHYGQLTNDPFSKNDMGWPPPVVDSPLASDGTRLYLTLRMPHSAMPAQVSIGGGEAVPMILPFRNGELMGISPDHSELLVLSYTSEDVEVPMWVVPTLGGSPRRLGDLVGHDVAWSPDKRTLAFALGDGLYTKSAGMEKRKLYTAGNGAVLWPRWSPDGKRLRFTVEDSEHLSSALWEIRADGSNARMLLPGWNKPAVECCGEWSPDGSYYFFQTGGFLNSQIWAVRDGWMGISKPFPITAGPLSFSSPLPSAESGRLYAVGRQGRNELVRLDLKSGKAIPVPSIPSVSSLRYSRDGKWITYVTYPEGALWRSHRDGSERLQLTQAPLLAGAPQWSPDGKQILFTGSRVGSASQNYVISIDGGRIETLLPENRNQGPGDWSPDGKAIVFGRMAFLEVGKTLPAMLVRVDLATHRGTELAGTDGMHLPAWSPDGKMIAAVRGDETKPALYELATGKVTVLDHVQGTAPAWTQDGKVFFLLGGGKVIRWSATGRVEEVARGIPLISTGANSWLNGNFLALDQEGMPLTVRDAGSSQLYLLEWRSR